MSRNTSLQTPPSSLPLHKRYLDPATVESYDRRYQGPLRRFKGAYWRRLALRAFADADIRGVCLDIPCGTGYLSEVLHGRCRTLIAGDISPTMVRKTRTKVDTPGVVADAAALPFAGESIDCVANNRFMAHFSHEQRIVYLKSLARVSRRYVLVNYNHAYTLKNLVRWIRKRLGRRRNRKAPPHKCTRRELHEEVRAAGLRIVRIYQPLMGLEPFSERWLVLCEKVDPGRD